MSISSMFVLAEDLLQQHIQRNPTFLNELNKGIYESTY